MAVSRVKLDRIKKQLDEAQAIYDELCVQIDAMKQGIKSWDISDNIYGVRLPDGSYPLVPLMTSKAEAFSTLVNLVKDQEDEKEKVRKALDAEEWVRIQRETARRRGHYYY